MRRNGCSSGISSWRPSLRKRGTCRSAPSGRRWRSFGSRSKSSNLDLAKAKLAEQCTKARERHELKVLRAKLRAKLAAARQAAGGRRRKAATAEARKLSVNWRGSGPGRTRSLVRLGPPSRRWPNCSGCPPRTAKRRPAPSGRPFRGPRRTAVRRPNASGRQLPESPAGGRRPTGPSLPGRWRMATHTAFAEYVQTDERRDAETTATPSGLALTT